MIEKGPENSLKITVRYLMEDFACHHNLLKNYFKILFHILLPRCQRFPSKEPSRSGKGWEECRNRNMTVHELITVEAEEGV